ALARNATVVPALLCGATAAPLSGLPTALAELSLRQAVELHDASFNDDCARPAASLGLSRTRSFLKPVLWAGAAGLAAIVLFLAASAGMGPWRASHERNARVAALLATAVTQIDQTAYEFAFASYQQVLSFDSANRAALDGGADAARLWLEHFHVVVSEGQKAE